MRKFYFYTYVKIEKRGDHVKKKISASLLAMLLVFQVMSSGYLAPMAAFANEPVSTNETTDTQAPEQTAEQQAEAEAAQKKALEEAQANVAELFTDATKTEITSYVTIYTFNRDFLKDVEEGKEREALQHDLDLAQTFVTVNALFKEDRKTIVDGLQKTTVDAATAQIQNLQGASAESKNALEEKIKLASEQLEKSATQAEKEEVTKTEPKEETTKTESKEEKVTSKKKATLQTKEAASEPEIKKISLWTAKPEANDKAEGGHDLFTPKGDNLSTTAVNTGAGFFALYDWVLPKGTYEEGKTYELEFETPSQFKGIETGTQVLTTVEGDKIGTYKVSGRTVTLSFTFTSEQTGLLGALKDEDLLGQFWVGHGFELSAAELEQDEVTVDYKKGDVVIASIIVKQKQEPVAPKIVKSGEKVIDDDGNVQIKWTVDVNNTKETNKTVVLEDTLPAGLTITKATMQQYETTSKGVFTTPVAGTEKNITVSGNTLPLGEISAPYRVTYYTDIPDTQQEGTKTFTNSVKATGLSQVLTDQATVKIDFGKPLVKEGVGYNTEKQLATWRIAYNGNHKKVIKGTVQDTFKSGTGFAEHEFVEITKVTKVDKNGAETKVDPSESGIIVTPDGSKSVTFNMPDGTNQYIFEYTTKPVQRLSSNDKLGNTASFECKGVEVANTGDIEIKGQQGVGVKSGKVDYAQKTVKWTITLNSDLNGIKKDTVIQDIFGDNEALVMTDDQFTALQSAYKAATGDNEAQFSRKSPENKGFEITLGEDIKEKVSFTYETNFDTSKLTGNKTALDNAIIVGKQDTTAAETNDRITITPKDLTLNNGEKRGVYNPKTKETTWTAIINYNLRTLNNLTITDVFSNNQTYVDGSMKISELELDAVQNSFTEGEFKELKPTLTEPGPGLTFVLPENNKAYKVTYKTKVGDKVTGQTYTNTISYTDGVKEYKLTDSVTPNYATDPTPGSNADLIKTGKQDGEYAHWRVLINPAQNVYKTEYIFQDTIDVTKHRFVEGSVKISKVTASETDGNYLDHATATIPIKNGENGIADFEITTNDTTSILAFNFPTGLDETYVLEYDTLLLVDDGKSVSNKATFYAEGQSVGAGSNQSNVQVSWAAAGASAAINGSGKLKIKKVSPTNQPIEGIQFIIYDLKGKELEKITTDANGIAETKNKYKFKEYLVEEVAESASSLNYKPITGKNKYILTNITATDDTEYNEKTRPVTAVIANELNAIDDKSCTTQEITITNGRTDKVIEKVVLYRADGTKVQEFTGSSIGTEESKTFQIPTELLGENYKVKVFYKGEKYHEIAKNDFKWDYQSYENGVATDDCSGTYSIVNTKACPDFVINVVDEKGDKIKEKAFLEGSTFAITIKKPNNVEVVTDVRINVDGKLVDSKGKIINKDELKNYTTDTYTLVQTKTAPGYQTMKDVEVQDLGDCSGLVTINFNKTTEPTNPGVSCPYFTIIYKGPADSTAEFKLVKVTKDATTGEVTKTDGEKDIKVVTDPTTKVSTLDLKDTKSFEPGSYELVQTKGTSGYYNSNDIPFEVKMGECVAELTVTNTVVPPPACTNDVVVTVKDTEGKAVLTENAKVTVDGKETTVTGSNSQVTIPKTALDSSKEQTVIITLEDGRTTTVVLPANRVDCTANAVVPVLKVCEQDKTITIKDANGKDVPADKIVKVTVGDKEVTPKVENGKLVISKDLINPKEDTTITVTTKGGEQGFVTIPKYSETCDYTIVIQNACDAFTVNVTENGKKATTGNVSIVDADGKTVATEKVSANGTAKFPAKYADAAYTVNVTIGKTTVTTPVNVNENCAVTVNVKTLACDEAAVVVTLDGKAQKGVKVSVVDSKGKVVQTVTTDAKGNAKIDPKYATKEYQVKVTVGKETKTVTMTSCNVTINFKAPVTDGETEEPTEPGKPNKPTTPEKPSKPGVVTGGDTEENTNSSKPSKPGVKPGDHYDVYDKDGNLVASDVTVDKDGNISADLPPGEYDFVSKGEHVTAEVGKDGKLPQTGSSDFLLYTLAGIALLGASLVVFARGRKKSA